MPSRNGGCIPPSSVRQPGRYEPVHLHFMGASTKKDGPSAGGAIALALASLLLGIFGAPLFDLLVIGRPA